jgi:hypothetical protein
MNSSKLKRKPCNWLLILLLSLAGLIVALVAIFTVGLATQNHTPDGTADYSGVKLEAARNVIDFTRDDLNTLFTPQVVDVFPTPQGTDGQGKPLRCTDNPNKIQYYSVTIRMVTLFGMTYSDGTYNVCNTAG